MTMWSSVAFLRYGDKLTPEHGQIGICGAQRRLSIAPPSTADILNPHAPPPRMTIEQILTAALVFADTTETG